MRLHELHVDCLRNLTNVGLELAPALNLFAGENGSGKTSLLESVYYLGTGRSFRGTQIDPIIQRTQNHCMVTGTVVSESQQVTRLGVQRMESGQRLIRIDGETIPQSSALAQYLPTLLLGPATVELLTGPPGPRRNFLNWGVFHVKPEFSRLWQEGLRVLKQRNALLRDDGTDEELRVWTERFVLVANQIDELRQSYFSQFLPVFTETYRFLMGGEGVKCVYRKGWDGELEEVVKGQLNSDRQRRFTQSGFQRADLRMTIEGTPVSQVCSRGELKLLSWAMIITQGGILPGKPIYLVDDLIAELDEKHQTAIAQLLLDQGGQVLVTGTDSERLKAIWGKTQAKLFHVEQGEIRERE